MVEEPQVEGYDLGVAWRRRITRQLLIGVPLVLGWAIFAAKGPAWLVDRAKESTNACLERAYHAHGDPSGCRLGAGFALARHFPEVRERANEIERSFLQRRAEDWFDAVMASKPNVVRRDGAAAQLLHDVPDPERAAGYAAEAGAFGPLATVGRGANVWRRDSDPAFAALALGDIAGARAALARAGKGEPRDLVEAAALACLLGDRQRGLAMLRSAGEAARRGGYPDDAARVAAQHCGGSLDTVGFDPYVVSSTLDEEAVLARLFDPKVQVGRRAAVGTALLRDTTIYRSVAVAPLALAMSGTDEPTPHEALEAFAGPYRAAVPLDAIFDAGPWPVPAEIGDAYVEYMPPAWFEVAAARCAHVAARAPARFDAEDERLSADAAAHPRELLRAAARMLYQFSAGFDVRRGDRAAARRVLEQWRAFEPIDLRIAPLEIAAGDPAAALATCDAWRAAQQGTPSDAADDVEELNRTFALAALGRYAEAFAIAKKVEGQRGQWLVLAMALASGAPLDRLELEAGDADDKVTPARVLAAILQKQAVHELSYLRDEERAVLPAVLAAIARSAQVAGEDPEVVLDRDLAQDMPSRTIARARAEAARWRNDTASAQLWDKRAAAIESLFVDDDAVVLAGVAGLW